MTVFSIAHLSGKVLLITSRRRSEDQHQQGMILKGCASAFQLQQISIFHDLDRLQINTLLLFSYWQEYQSSEIVMNEGE
jgi:hypothetical protein